MLNLQLVLGGARSGKSRLAENYAKATEKPVIYIATAQAGDNEMAGRIQQHQQQRPKHWQLVESPLNLAQTIETHINEAHCIVVDCLTLWLNNCLCEQGVDYWLKEQQALIEVLNKASGHLIFVSNEVGHGIVPMGQLSRDFVDYSGWLHQALADIATSVDFVIAGIPLSMKSPNEQSRLKP